MTTAATEPDRIHVRETAQADLLAVFNIEKASFAQPWPFSAFEQFLDKPGFLVAVDGASVVGYVVADHVPNHGRALGHVKDLAVHPEYRGRGIGSKLLRRAFTVLAMDGADTVKLEVRRSNGTAISLYEEFGFEPLRVVPGYYADGEDAIIMVVDLHAEA